MKTSSASIRSFDGTKKEVIGETELEVTIGPVRFLINFQVVDIQSSFNFLLGRPWIHTAGAVPSSLHQKVRFAIDGKLITVHGESDFIGHLGDDVPFVHPGSTDSGDYAYYSLQLIHAVHTPAGTIMRSPQLSKSSIMTGRVLMENGFEPGKGLGKNAQGIAEPITLLPSTARRGLGFHGESAEQGGYWERSGSRGRGRGNRGRRAGRSIKPELWKGKTKEVKYCDIPLEYTFPGPSKWLQDEDIHAAVEDESPPLSEENFVNVITTAKSYLPALE